MFASASFASETFAGTVITANLPPNTAIINIDGRADGAASFSGPNQSLWYQPFNTGSSLLEYTVQAGTYNFRVINPADAAQLFPSLTSGQTNSIFTAWTYNSPWTEDYLVFDSSAAVNSSVPQLFDGCPADSQNSAAAAYSTAVSTGAYNKIRVGPLGRSSTNIVSSFTFTNSAALIFVIPDYYLPDNGGGVSVLVSPAIPALTLGILPVPHGSVTLQWPTNYVGFNLAQATNLPAGPWSDVGITPGVSNTNFSVTVPMGTNRFFRLHN